MPSDEKLTASDAFDIADAMQAAAAATLTWRRANKASLQDHPDAYNELIDQETALRYDADRYRAVGIRLLANQGSITAKGLSSAIDEAVICINKINEIKKLLNITAELVNLGTTIVGGNVPAIARQLAVLQATLKTNNAV